MPSSRRLRAAAAVAAAAVLVTACGLRDAPAGVAELTGDGAQAVAAPAPAPTAPAAPPIDDQAAVQETLDAAAAAFLAADPDRIRPWLEDPGSRFGRRWLERAANLAEVPLSEYGLRLDTSLPDLATAEVRSSYDADGVQVLYVVESYALEGFDEEGPASEDLFLTMVRRNGTWRVAGDGDAEPLGLVSADHLWDHGPVVISGRPPVAALHHPGTRNIPEILREAGEGLAEASERWPLAWPERVPILVPEDEDELRELLHVTFDLSSFVAFATATPVHDLTDYRLTGSRIVLNPDRFLDRDSATRQRILVHELVHVATRPVAGPLVPAWVDEGIAQALGEQASTTGTRLLDGLSASALDLPLDAEFVTGGSDRIFLSYQLAWSFVDWLRDEHGPAAVGRFYASLGAGAIGAPGTTDHHVDRAAREVFGSGIDELVTGWRSSR